jgi:amino acid adenylation domain-containing protein
VARLLQQLLVDSAARLPDKEAVRFDGRALTYRELEESSKQLATALQAVGVARGDRIGIYLPKSLESVVAVFGTLFAGAAYVPLDPNEPPGRTGTIIRDCGIQTLVTASRAPGLVGLLAEDTPLGAVVCVDDGQPTGLPADVTVLGEADVRRQDPARLPAASTIETDLAYVLYTSGSTGTPKGVMISHRASLTFIDWSVAAVALTAADRVTNHAPLQFDLSTFDIFATIAAGGTVVLVPEGTSIFPGRLAALLERERITVTYLVPSVLSLLVTYGELHAHDLSSVRAVLFAGEVLPIRNLRLSVAAMPEAAHYNLYGPTETNVCTSYRVQPRDLAPDRTQPVPIGRACANTEVFAVGEGGELVTEPGATGELWVRGPGLASGYWGDPERTARQFVANPYQVQFREIAYRTGDIVSLTDNGVDWQYVGRRDQMVKSRGYRIELGEIEAALYADPGVKDAAVVTVPDDLLGNRVKAYVVLAPGAELTPMELRASCSRRLPRYMVPDSIELCEDLPRTATGKVDRPMLAKA